MKRIISIITIVLSLGFTCLNSVSANEPPRKCFSSINGHFQIKYFDEVYDVFL